MVVEAPEENDESTKNKKGTWMVGRILTNNNVNPMEFKTTMVQAWNVKKGVEVRDVSKNLKEKVMNREPWNLDK